MNAHSINNPDFKEVVLTKPSNARSTSGIKVEISKIDRMLNGDEQPVLKTFGKENAKMLRDARLSRNLTQKDLGLKINETQKVINLYEIGNNVPDKTVVEKLRKELRIKFNKI